MRHATAIRLRVLVVACSVLSLLLLASVAQAGAETATITIDGDGVTPKRVTASLGNALRWANEDFRPHWVALPEGFFRTGRISPSDTSERVVTISAGSFDYSTDGRSGDSEGTVSVPVRIWPGPRSTPTPGARIRVILTTHWRSDRAYDVQRRRDDGDWVMIARDTSRTKIIFMPRRTGTFWFRTRVELVEGGTSMWSPPKEKDVAPPP